MQMKYKKFLTTAATATLVASAIAPAVNAASFSDTAGNTHERAIDSLVSQGIISGYPDGTFKPNRTLTRSDVVKLLGKYLVSQGYKIPSDYKTNMRFSDLRSTSQDELLQYAALVKDNGVFNGSNGNLLPGDPITRENMAVVLVRAYTNINNFDFLGYVIGQDFSEDVVDYNRAKAEARSAIRVLDYYNVTGVPNFNPKSFTTRGQFSSFLYKMLQVEVPGEGLKAVEVINASTLKVTLTNNTEHTVNLETPLEAGKETPVKFTINGKEYGTSVTYNVPLTVKSAEATGANKLKVTLSDNSEHEVTLENNLPENEETTVDFKIDGKDYSAKVTYVVTEVKVATVKALNGGQLEVKFNQRVDLPASLTQAQLANYVTVADVDSLNAITLSRGQLSEDGRTLTIFTNGTTALTGRYLVKVNNVKNAAGTTVTPYEEIVNFGTDTVAPTLISTVNRDAKTVRVTFSEPLRAFSNSSVTFRLANGTNVAGITGEIAAGATYTDFDLSNATVNGQPLAANTQVEATFAGLRDIAGNFSTPNPLKTSFAMGGADGVKPTLTSISQTGPKTFRLTFSERIQKPAVTDLELRLGNSPNAITAIEAVPGDDRSFIVTATIDLTGVYNIGTASGKTITDISGETNTFTTAHSFTLDTAAPEVTSTSVTREGNFEYLNITLNKPVDLVTASRVTASGNYVKGGVTHRFSGTATPLEYRENGNRSVVRVKLDDLLGSADADNATYNVTLSFTEVDSAYGINTANKAVTFQRTADYTNNDNVLVAPTVTTSVTDSTLTNNQVRLKFNHVVDATTAANASNYSIPNAKIANAQVPSDALDTVILTLTPNETTTTGSRNLTIRNVKAKDSIASQRDLTAVVDLKENIRPVLNSARFTSANQIELTFSENVSGLDTDSFVIVNAAGATIGITSVAESTTGNTVTVTLASNQAINTSVTITQGAGIEDVVDGAGNPVVHPFTLTTTLRTN
ncbi:S-layer homology domain-containing protein [Solibacillus isronensis]|uniref:S-layer homology domain-containing protein n=1 Tax=Solibacillus isronensis TaxID=412383 RepID=UPI00203EF641|nr:S-layer homology domain-containing protein [Solibacillus isronensis]MCM3722513.1 S-layer homology domain-containing protein [Solibacillus isronensis]